MQKIHFWHCQRFSENDLPKYFGGKNTSDKRQIKITDHFTARTVFNTVLTGEEMLDLVRDLCTGDTHEPQPNPSAHVEMAKEKPVNRGTFKKLLHTFSINSTQIRRLGCLDLVMQNAYVCSLLSGNHFTSRICRSDEPSFLLFVASCNHHWLSSLTCCLISGAFMDQGRLGNLLDANSLSVQDIVSNVPWKK